MGNKVFDINEIISRFGLSEEDVAEVLFPTIRYKAAALNRIKRGEATIDANQLQALASFCGTNIDDLYCSWGYKMGYDAELKCLVFKIGDYAARLNYQGTFLSIYKGPEMIAQEVMFSNMPINDFLQLINNIIEKYENGRI